jgi:hypothetical protein
MLQLDDVIIFHRGTKIVWQIESWRARIWFRKHFADEVVHHRMIFNHDRAEQEAWNRIHSIGDREGYTGFMFRVDHDQP